MNKSSLLEEFRTALQEEIDYIKEKGGDSKFVLRNGQLVDSYGGKFIYEFITETPIELDEDTPINIKYGTESVSGSIININGLKVLLGLNKDIGSKVTEITITASAYFLLERLQERISDIESKKLPFNIDMSLKAFGFHGSLTNRVPNLMGDFQNFPISEEQKDALSQALGNEVTFIWGPPGTGKTTVLSYLANEFLLRGNSMLLVSHTNVAIDNALGFIAKILKKRNAKEYLNGQVLRIGNPPHKELFENYHELKLDYWVEEQSKEFNKELTKLENELEKQQKVLDDLNAVLRIFSDIDDTERKIIDFKQNIATTTDVLARVKKRIEETKGKILDTQNKLQKARDSHPISRFFLGLNPKKLEGVLDKLASTLKEENSKLSRLNSQLEVEQNNLGKTEEKYAELKSKLIKLSEKGSVLEKSKVQKEADEQKEIIGQINQKINTIKTVMQELAQKIVQDAKLIGTTITKGYLNPDIYQRSFDVTIVDEASMAPLPALFFNCGLAGLKVVIIGDFRQLGPIATADGELAQKWLRRDIFEVSGIQERVDKGEEEKHLAVLKEQRRMPEEIAELVNEPIYKNTLVTKKKPDEKSNKEEDIVASQPFPQKNIVLCDTSEFNPWCVKSSVQNSPFNVYNAFLSTRLAEQALLSGVEDIAIITPYRSQASLIHKLVATLGNEASEKVLPASVHRFQGREAGLVIFDLVEGPMRNIRWLSGPFGSEAMRIINVAITRAQAKIIFIANLKYLKKKLDKQSILRQILEDVEKNHLVVNTEEFFPFIRIPIEKTETIKLDDTLPHFCNQTYFYKAFQNDLSNAESKVVIVSPFMTQNRLASFEAVFRDLHSREVKTFIFTKPFKEQGFSGNLGEEITENLKKLAIELVPKPLSHEKLAVIDDKVIWQGSLNILSHKNTSELMIRFATKDAKVSNEILKLCGINPEKIIEESIIDEKIKLLNKRGVGFCSRSHPLVIKRSSRGLFLSCSRFPDHRETQEVPIDVIAEIFGRNYLYCEKCSSQMKIRFNRKRMSRFLGCSKYPDCHFTRPL
jgi:ssDNA-binding Zn-finger/Zn-ribbon topoisomerase 1